MIFGTLLTLPDASTTLAAVGDYSAPIFTDLLPFFYLAIGVFLGLFVVSWLIGLVARHVFHAHHQ